MCNWSIIPIAPQFPTAIEVKGVQVPTGLPKFDTKFEAHMKGKEGKAQHSGLHTVNGLTEGTDYIIEKNADNAPNRVRAIACNQVYCANVKLKTGVTKMGDSEWEKEFKLSTFFPDTMCLTHVQEATVKAYLFWKGVTQHAGDYTAELADIETIATGGTKWAGKVKLRLNRQDSTIWVGSLQTGESDNSKLYNSFPTLGTPNFA
jgi:hypothetical protein